MSAEMQGHLKDYLNEGRSVKIFIAGKMGVGKSSLINSIYGAELAKEGNSAAAVTGNIISFTASIPTPCDGDNNSVSSLTVWDSPGFGDVFATNREKMIQELIIIVNEAHILLYCFDIRGRLTRDDCEGIVEITKRVRPDIWRNAVFVLTFCNELNQPTNRNVDHVQFFAEKFKSWHEQITKVLREKADVPRNIVDEISVTACGYRNMQPPGYRNWYTTFWTSVFQRIRDDGQSALLKLSYMRLKDDGSDSVPDISDLEPPSSAANHMHSPYALQVNLYSTMEVPGVVAAATGSGPSQSPFAPVSVNTMLSGLSADGSMCQEPRHKTPPPADSDVEVSWRNVSNGLSMDQGTLHEPATSRYETPSLLVEFEAQTRRASNERSASDSNHHVTRTGRSSSVPAVHHAPVTQPHPQLLSLSQPHLLPHPPPQPHAQMEEPPDASRSVLGPFLKGGGSIAGLAATGAIVGALIGLAGGGFGVGAGALGGAVVGASISVIAIISLKVYYRYIKKRKKLERMAEP